MKRFILALVVAAMLLIGSAIPALANHEMGDPNDVPGEPKCDWYGPFGEGHQAWWEYWCYWPHWGWEFVFWVWA